MDYIELGKILMKWSLKNGDYTFVHYLYIEGIGIPVKEIYNLPDSRKFDSIDSFLGSNNGYKGGGKELNDLLRLLPKSSYVRLEEWDGLYGYRF